MEKITVIGAGTMGIGIAQIAAMAGFETVLYDLQDNALKIAETTVNKNLNKGLQLGKITADDKKEALRNISFTTTLVTSGSAFVIEAIVENLDIKKALFKKIEEESEEDIILATNTSSIPVTQIASGLKHANRFVGMHFFNPAHIMPLVEVIQGVATSQETVKKTVALAKKLNKVPVIAKDSPGFIVNRVARHYYVESLKILEEGVAGVADIDTLLRSCGFRMGPFELMDLIGVDTNYAVTESMFHAFGMDSKFRPSRIQQQKVDAGHHGKKTGRGFYEYED